MATTTTRALSQKLIKNLRCSVRPLNSAPSSISALPITFTGNSDPNFPKPPPTQQQQQQQQQQPPSSSSPSILNLDDGKEIFATVPTAGLLRSSAILQASAIEPMVDVGTWVMNSRLMGVAGVRELVLWGVKNSFFEHFCAGENPVEARRVVMKLWESGLRGMLDYGLENAIDNESCDRNLNGFLQTIDSAKSLPPSSVSFVVVKITALCPLPLLRRVSDLLRWEHRVPSFHLPWKLNTLPLFSESSPLYHTPSQPLPLSPQEESDLHLAHLRLLHLCHQCQEARVPLLVDAEDTAVQPAIDYFTYAASIAHNRDDDVLVFGTVQAYLKDAKERVVRASMAADELGVPLGFKLVRGAYMSSERELANSLGVESPIHNTIQETHSCYDECASMLIEKIANGPGGLVLATHNIDSGKMAAAKARDLGIGKGTEKLQFAQLYGMAEALSYGLRNAGFQVSKYMPFGPVAQIMPYLLRRAEENRGLLSTSTLDRHLMRKELVRRLKAAVMF